MNGERQSHLCDSDEMLHDRSSFLLIILSEDRLGDPASDLQYNQGQGIV